MTGLGYQPQPGGFPWRTVLVVAGVAAMVAMGGLLSRSDTPPSFATDGEPAAAHTPRINVADLREVLRFGRMPRKFSFGGKPYEALTAYDYGSYLPLIRAGSLPDGHLVYYEKGSSTKPYQTLYLRVADGGPGSALYVRYRLAPPLQIP